VRTADNPFIPLVALSLITAIHHVAQSSIVYIASTTVWPLVDHLHLQCYALFRTWLCLTIRQRLEPEIVPDRDSWSVWWSKEALHCGERCASLLQGVQGKADLYADAW
jgi:hypothetical protein